MLSSLDRTALVQVILRSTVNVACLVILGLTIYCHVEFNEAIKVAYAAALSPFIINSVLIYVYWALYNGRVDNPDNAANKINYTRMVIGDCIIVVVMAASAGYMAAMDLHRFQPGNRASDAPYKADPWRMIAFGFQISAGALQLCAALWNCVGCTRARKRYTNV